MTIVRNLIVTCGFGGDESAIILQGYGQMLYQIEGEVEWEWMPSGIGVSVAIPAKVKPIEKLEKWRYDYLFKFLNQITSTVIKGFSEAMEIEASTSKDFEESKSVKSKLGKVFSETNSIRGFTSINFGETLPTIGTVIKSFDETIHLVASKLAIPFSKLQRITGQTISTYESIEAEVKWEEEKLEIEKHNL